MVSFATKTAKQVPGNLLLGTRWEGEDVHIALGSGRWVHIHRETETAFREGGGG